MYAEIQDGVVVSTQPTPADGLVEAPGHVEPGFLYDSGSGEFTAPDTSPTDQEKRDRLAAEARRILAIELDAQQQEYERDTRLGLTPQADSYTYTARDGTSYSGRESLDRWGDDLRAIIREAADGTLDPAAELPSPPA